MKHKAVAIAKENSGQWRGVLEIRETTAMGGGMPCFRKTMEDEKDSQTEALAHVMLYYAQHVEKVLKGVGIVTKIEIVTQEVED